MSVLLIFSGLLGLWLGTGWIVTAATGMASHFRLSHAFVGVAILAVGTDLPEVFVTLKASLLNLRGVESSGIIVGNALGSSLCQISIILGLAALFTRFTISAKELRVDGAALVLSVVLFYLFSLDGTVSSSEGMVMLAVYVIYYVLLVRRPGNMTEEAPAPATHKPWLLGLLFALGLVILVFSSHLVVDNAMKLAAVLGVAQSFVGALIIGLGTSLPELAVSIGAAVRKAPGMSVGNIIGSNIFDGLIPVGLGATISPLTVGGDLLSFDIAALAVVTLLSLVMLRSRRGISMPEGMALIGFYLMYAAVKVYTA